MFCEFGKLIIHKNDTLLDMLIQYFSSFMTVLLVLFFINACSPQIQSKNEYQQKPTLDSETTVKNDFKLPPLEYSPEIVWEKFINFEK